MKNEELEEKSIQILQAVFQEIPFVRSIMIEKAGSPASPDFIVEMKLPKMKVRLLVEARTSGQPRLAREAVNQLLRFQENRPDSYLVFIAPYISNDAAQICMEAGTGYLDMAGNAYLSFGLIFISREGRKNPYVSARRLKSLYQPKSSRVLRSLLMDPRKSWKLQELSKEANVSIGQVANVKRVLKDREWIKEDRNGLWLSAPEKLLADWAQNYLTQRKGIREFYSLADTSFIEKDIAEACNRLEVRYALTGFSGAARLAPAVRYKRVDVYLAEKVDEIALEANLKEEIGRASCRERV